MADVKAPSLSPHMLRNAEFVRAVHVAEIAPGVPMQSVLRPEFWAHCAGQLKQYGRIECRAQDNSWFAELLVMSIGKQEVKVRVLNYVDFTSQVEAHVGQSTVEQYAVSFAPKHRWRVIRTSDSAVVHKDEDTEDSAKAWLTEHLKTTA